MIASTTAQPHEQNQTNKQNALLEFVYILSPDLNVRTHSTAYSVWICACNTIMSRIEFHFYFTVFIFVWHCSCRLLLALLLLPLLLLLFSFKLLLLSVERVDYPFRMIRWLISRVECMWISTSLFSAILTIII